MPFPIEAKIRMYRYGFGDCFLLQFTNTNTGATKKILIDCGVHQNVKTANKDRLINKVVPHIKTSCTDEIDIVVVTHEHWDHVSGFGKDYAQHFFDDISFESVWMSWIEDPKDTLARKIKKDHGKRVRSLQMALEKMVAMGLDEDYIEHFDAFLGFWGKGMAAAEVESEDLSNMMKYVKGKVNDEVDYFKPGKVFTLSDDFPEIKVYVIGPPRSDAQIVKDSDSAKEGQLYLDEERYDAFQRLLQGMDLRGGNKNNMNDLEEQEAKNYPFHHKEKISEIAAQKVNFFKEHFFERESQWRKIPQDWLQEFNDLAMQLVEGVNNISLVLAFELGENGKVLLFPGDAELGNWETWQNVKFKLDDDTTISALDLLKRTVFYKVGHHGSQNATLRDNGLEIMSDENLVAMIPVDKQFGQITKKKNPWKMPYKGILERLTQKTSGRVIEADTGDLKETDDRIKEVIQNNGFTWQLFDANELEVHNDFIELTISA